jgi:aminoglycoside phosphotransferase (APT) family kinase protein
MIDAEQAAKLVASPLKIEPVAMHRQTLTFSGNDVFQAQLPGDRSVVLRVSPRPSTFKYTGLNLDALRQLQLPVQRVLASGPVAGGGSFIILNWLPGRDLMYQLPSMRKEQMTRAAEAMTDYQQRIGALPIGEGFGWAPIGKKASSARWSDIFGPAGTEPAPVNSSPVDQLKYRLRLARQSVEPYFATVRPVCFLDDLTIKNVLVENGELTGLIDIDFACFGDPLMSVGTSLALLAVDVGDAGQFYADELVRCWKPSQEQLRAIHFYAALWTIGIAGTAETAGETQKVQQLLPIADRMMQIAEAHCDAALLRRAA